MVKQRQGIIHAKINSVKTHKEMVIRVLHQYLVVSLPAPGWYIAALVLVSSNICIVT